MADMDAMALGSYSEARRTYRKLVSAGLLTRLFNAKQIHEEFTAQVNNCSVTGSGGPQTATNDIRQLTARHSLEITHATGIPPQQQYTQFTLSEYAGLVKHCSWASHREDVFHAHQAGGPAVLKYPRHDLSAPGEESRGHGAGPYP